MKNSTFWEPLYYFISGRNKYLKTNTPFTKLYSWIKLDPKITLLGLLFIGACGPVPEETARQKAYKDTAEADSLMKIEAAKIKAYERAKKIHEDSIFTAQKLIYLKNHRDSLNDSVPLIKKIVKPLKSKKDTGLRNTPSTPDSSRLKKMKFQLKPAVIKKNTQDSTN